MYKHTTHTYMCAYISVFGKTPNKNEDNSSQLPVFRERNDYNNKRDSRE